MKTRPRCAAAVRRRETSRNSEKVDMTTTNDPKTKIQQKNEVTTATHLQPT